MKKKDKINIFYKVCLVNVFLQESESQQKLIPEF